jgi:tetratricopeptide (TPR) repeat protein
MFGSLRICLICVVLTTLAACKTSEERAEEFYQSGLSLIESGDFERAAIEFLNVFQHNGQHKEARQALADLRLEQGEVQAAYSQYLRLIEQYPDTPEVRLTLAEIALESSNWDEALRHGNAAIRLVPEDPRAKALSIAFDYREGTRDNDAEALDIAALQARLLLESNPEDDVSRRVVIDNLLRGEDPMKALPEIDIALQRDPEHYIYNQLKLRLLERDQDIDGVGAQLQQMVTLFPEDEELGQSLIRWYLFQEDVEGAENFLRSLAGDETGPTDGHITVVQLIQATQGDAAAQAELDRLASVNAGNPNADLYGALSSVITFQDGDRDGAISTIQDIIAGAEPTEQTWRVRNILARFLIATDNLVGARAEVETILTEDASNVDALKLRAGWAIEDDRGSAAILDLRRALGQEPRDPEILTLMAEAHDREGSMALAGERLALAVDITGSAPDESLRYASFLQRQGRDVAARSVLSDARAANPTNVPVLIAFARTLLTAQAWVEAQEITNTLRAIDDPEAQEAATSLQAALLLGQNRTEDSLSFLKQQIDDGTADITAISQAVLINLQNGDVEAARAFLDEALANAPEDSNLQMMDASLLAVTGDFAEAEAIFRDLIAQFPQSENLVLRLYNMLLATGQADAARSVLDDALAAQPTSLTLRWMRAGELETVGDFEGAIAVYEEMYAENSSATAIANNLASLISTHRDDEESLERAANIAKRLRELDVPPFQDTYGWIAYRQGNFEEARLFLVPAAAGLPNDPLVQYHLGMTYAALGNAEKARTQLTRALELAGDSPLPQFSLAREKLQELGD